MHDLMDIRIGLSALAVALLCAAGAQLGAPPWMWAGAAGVAVGLLFYAVLVPSTGHGQDSGEGRSEGVISQSGSGAGSRYENSKVYNVTIEGERKSESPDTSGGNG
jgi:hypothetical protein